HVWVDPENTIPEASEDNNLAIKTLYVQTKPDMRVRNEDIAFTDNNPYHNDNIQILAMIRNIESEPTGPFTVRFYDNEYSNLIDEVQLDLGPHQTELAIVNYTTTFGNHTIHVKADPLNQVDEWDETNNHAQKPLWVRRRPINHASSPLFMKEPTLLRVP
ncbi:MAG: hypothetical protein KJ709_01745, partial [Nanoarchaeota archaeon]|nr:hypothetical protein [Nanoarchaeota archaeon]